jgi:F-type H+-transporting ATPase subunit b
MIALLSKYMGSRCYRAVCSVIAAGVFAVVVSFCGSSAATVHAAAIVVTQQSATAGQPQLQTGQKAKRREEIRQKKIDNPEIGQGENLYRHSPNVQAVARFLGWSTETTSRSFEILNFIILIIGIVWLLARIVPKALRARAERIRTELEQARIATENANRRLAAVEERLSRLDGEIDAIRAQAEQETAIEEKRLRAAIEKEKQSILDAASQDIAAATKNAQSLLKHLAADLVIERAKHEIAVSPATDQSLVQNFLSDLGERNQHSNNGVN